MKTKLDDKQIQAARRADLSAWVMDKHPEDVKEEGSRSLRMENDPSVVIGRGFSGFKDFSTGESGNSIDFLMNFYGYAFDEAVLELQDYTTVSDSSSSSPSPPSEELSERRKEFRLPIPKDGPYSQLIAYLIKTRKIPKPIVNKLIEEYAIYQEAEHNNIVFRSQQNDFAELHGTCSGKSFHGIVAASNPSGFWWFKSGDPESRTERAFVCEAGIDAMSLYAIHQDMLEKARSSGDSKYLTENDIPTLYVSIAGVSNHRRIDAVRAGFEDRPVYLAVDNDKAGEELRRRYSDMPFIIPENKDWNDDLLMITEVKK